MYLYIYIHIYSYNEEAGQWDERRLAKILQTSILLSLLEKLSILACARPFDIREMTHKVLPPHYIKVSSGAE